MVPPVHYFNMVPPVHYLKYMVGGSGRCHNLKNSKEVSENTEGKSRRMRWAR